MTRYFLALLLFIYAATGFAASSQTSLDKQQHQATTSQHELQQTKKNLEQKLRQQSKKLAKKRQLVKKLKHQLELMAKDPATDSKKRTDDTTTSPL